MKKPKILLVPNTPNWAFDNRANRIIKYLSRYYNFDKKYSGDLKNKKVNYDKYDCIFIFYWPDIDYLNIEEKVPKEKLITGIFSYNSWEGKKRYARKHFNKCKVVICATRDFQKEFKSKTYKTFYAPHGVDETKFFPIKKKNKSEKLIVGWAGNPDHKNKSYKGYWNILVPVVSRNKSWLELKSVLKGYSEIPHNKMNYFYNSIDILVCVSKGESVCNPVLEAGACGKPIISTRVGVIPEIIKNNYNGLLIKRNQKKLEKALKKLYKDKKLKKEMGKNMNQEILKNWKSKDRLLEYKKAFDYVIKN